MSYFLRFTANADADLERGYSFVGYMLSETMEEALRELAELTTDINNDDDFDFETWAEVNADRIAQDNVTNLWGARRCGLCGFGSFDTIEDALAAINSDDLGQYWGQPTLAIFEGESCENLYYDGCEGDLTFTPAAIISRLNWNGSSYS